VRGNAPWQKFVRGSEEEGLPPKKTKASVLAKLQLENEMVEEDNPLFTVMISRQNSNFNI